jgi:hypothetical protein
MEIGGYVLRPFNLRQFFHDEFQFEMILIFNREMNSKVVSNQLQQVL